MIDSDDYVDPADPRYASEPVVSNIRRPPMRRCASEASSAGLMRAIGRRPRASSAGQFTITNLAPNTSEADLTKSLAEHGIPSEALVILP